ncbi:Chemotaxis protein CheC-inhibitor of MCP methylation [gamma proteobacterium IMCC1989]|jgi:chemotaxis protein CheC|nr:Chemotaxis protein CheC-inhibitor of MCP methylation [gamma proteobacterium IMCC1989]
MSQPIVLSEDHRDCLQEISNVAMGQAGDHLARLLDAFVILSIPHVAILSPSEIAMAVQTVDDQNVSGVCQGFIGGGISGESMLLFNDTSFIDLAKLMGYEDEVSATAEKEVLIDATNILVGALLRGIAEQMDIEFSFGPPAILGQHQELDKLLSSKHVRWNQALVIEVGYQIENYDVQCDLLVVITERSLHYLLNKLNYLLG